MKPILYRSGGTWFCSGDDFIGYGDAPQEAYSMWLDLMIDCLS